MGLLDWLRRRRRGNLSEAQLAQRRYAAGMKGVRQRAARVDGGKGRIADREAARALRKKHGLKKG